MDSFTVGTGCPDTAPSSGSEVVELALLLPGWQLDALQELASDHGLTAGQMLRRVIGDLVAARRATR